MNILSELIFWDFRISSLMLALRTDFLDQSLFLITKLGNWQLIVFLFVLVSILFYFFKKRNLILYFFITLLGTGSMVLLIKYLVGRTRPGTGIALYTEIGASFPSAHSALVLAFFGFLIYCLWRFNIDLKMKLIFSFFFTLIILLVGFSRLYLGVHFLTDVIAGYLVGFLWLLIMIFYLSRHQNVDPSLHER